MNLKELIKTGPISRAQRIVIAGQNGVGKTTLASQFPNPIFVDTEDGSTHLALDRIAVDDYPSLLHALAALRVAEHSYRVLVLDTIDRIELFLRFKVCQDLHIAGMEQRPYGKAFQYLFESFDQFLTEQLDPFIRQGIHVVTVSHSGIRRVQLPGLEPFDKYEFKIHNTCAARLKEWSDAVLFLDFETRVIESDGKPKAVGGKERAIYTRRSANYDAKVRVELPEKIPCTFAAIEPVLCGWQREAQKSPQVHLAEALADIKDEQVRIFLIDRKQIQDDQSILDVPAEYAREALSRLPEFRKAVQEFDFIPV
jgi:GTPase SAR1 family protein